MCACHIYIIYIQLSCNSELLPHLVTWSGDGAPVNKKKAFQYYLAAARAGVSRAMNNLGYMLRVGDGVEENKEEALEWYLKGARAGDMDAQYHLGEPRSFVTCQSFTWECHSGDYIPTYGIQTLQ